jgi:hypothetical protein
MPNRWWCAIRNDIAYLLSLGFFLFRSRLLRPNCCSRSFSACYDQWVEPQLTWNGCQGFRYAAEEYAR